MIKRFRVIPHVGIEDDLTGQTFTNFKELCNVLNKIDERANKNAEKYYDILNKKNLIENELKVYNEITNKHNINSSNNIDRNINNNDNSRFKFFLCLIYH